MDLDNGRFPYSVFAVAGVELEYMIVNRSTLAVQPLCDLLLESAAGAIVSDFDNGSIMWSNELVNHVVEIKTNGPVSRVCEMVNPFHENVKQINKHLETFNAMLLPGGAHPWMNPFLETALWKYDSNEIYNLYNTIFDCRGHGWSNLQSTHINLPFGNMDEFGRLHAAIRVLLPIIPALCASSPILDGHFSGYLDARLEKYRANQANIPVIAGKIIPEQVFTENEYINRIFNPISEAIRPFDPNGILKIHFLNSRGAIARFDRGAIEIRLIDIQECSKADLAVVEGVIALLKMLVAEELISYEAQQAWHEDELAKVLLTCIRGAEWAQITNASFIKMWGVNETEVTAGFLWKFLLEKIKHKMDAELWDVLKLMIDNGSLATRIMGRIDGEFNPAKLKDVYYELAMSLQNNQLFNCKS
jgi:hypothetical protein